MSLLEIVQVKTPPVFEKTFSPPTAPRAMSTPVLAARLSSPVQTPLTSLLQRISQTCAPSPIAPEIDTPPRGSPARSSSPGVSLGREDSPVTRTNVATVLGKRKEGPAEEDEVTMPNSQDKVPSRPVPLSNNSVSNPGERPCNSSTSNVITPRPASPLRDHRQPMCPIQVLDQISNKEKDFPTSTGLLLVSGPVSCNFDFPNSLEIFSNRFLSSVITARR